MYAPRMRALGWTPVLLPAGILVALASVGVAPPSTAGAVAAGLVVAALLWELDQRRNG